MSRFSNGKVYKLVNGIDSKIYVGSTTQILCKRLADHKHTAKHKPQFVHTHLNTIGWDTVRIILIETVECFNKEQLMMREQHYIDLLNPELNKRASYVNCPHGREHCMCVECGGISICIHNRRKSTCIECGGSQTCSHNRQKRECKQCGGVRICIHNKNQKKCRDCCPKYCQSCDITTNKSDYLRHTRSKKHIYNFIHY